MEDMEPLTGEFQNALLRLDRVKAASIVEGCYTDGRGFAWLEALVTGALERVGRGWEDGSNSLSQVYMSGVICEELIDEYLPRMAVKRRDTPKLAIGVLLDHHALGKRIVYSVLRTAGYAVLDFGHGLTVDELVQKTLDNGVEVLLISTLMLPSALKVAEVRQKLRAAGSSAKIIVGGAPFRFDASLWKSVQADADGKNATDVAEAIARVWNGGAAL